MIAVRLHRVLPQCRKRSASIRIPAAIQETGVEIHLFPGKATSFFRCLITENVGSGLEVIAIAETVAEIRYIGIVGKQPFRYLGELVATAETVAEIRYSGIVVEQPFRYLGEPGATAETAAEIRCFFVVFEQSGRYLFEHVEPVATAETVAEIRCFFVVFEQPLRYMGGSLVQLWKQLLRSVPILSSGVTRFSNFEGLLFTFR